MLIHCCHLSGSQQRTYDNTRREVDNNCSQEAIIKDKQVLCSRSQWPRGRRRGSAAARWDCGFESRRGHGCLSCECCVLSGRGLCDGLITHPDESYRIWRVCDCEASTMRSWPIRGCRAMWGGGDVPCSLRS